MTVCGLVLAAGGSLRLGEAKQLLPFRGRTLLDAIRRDTFASLSGLHGDKAVWKLLHSGAFPVSEVRASGPTPIDVDTREDYRRLLAGEAR
jgi:CTP:molybdopterin cytidylyltransferase MocA